MRSRIRVLTFFTVLALVLGIVPRASAKLDSATWKEAKKSFKTLFSAPGRVEEKRALLALLLQDQQSRSWKLRRRRIRSQRSSTRSLTRCKRATSTGIQWRR